MIINSVDTTTFTGIYKLNVKDAQKVQKIVDNHEYLYRKSDIFEENNKKYMYAITSESQIAEHMFERDLRENKIPFWKSLPVNQIINKNIIESLFKITKNTSGKENWII